MNTKYLIKYVDRFTGEAEQLYCTEERLRFIQSQLESNGKEIKSVHPHK
jgi:hypothetical protein